MHAKVRKPESSNPSEKEKKSKENPRTGILATICVEKKSQKGILIGKGGKIVRTREQVMSTYYEHNPKATPDSDAQVQQPVKTMPQNPPSQTMKIEDTPVSSVVEEPMPEVKQEVSAEQAEEKVLDKGVEAVQKARARRKGIADATGEK